MLLISRFSLLHVTGIKVFRNLMAIYLFVGILFWGRCHVVCETERRTLINDFALGFDIFSRKNSMFGCRTRFSLASYYNSKNNGFFLVCCLKELGAGILTANNSECMYIVWERDAWPQSFITFELRRMGTAFWYSASYLSEMASFHWHAVIATVVTSFSACHGKPMCKSQILGGLLPSLILIFWLLRCLAVWWIWILILILRYDCVCS